MIAGFTGTQKGTTAEQRIRLLKFLWEEYAAITELHHGCCIGADVDAHYVAVLQELRTVGHPPENDSKRAYCEVDDEWEPKPYLVRNHDIVDVADIMFATPSGKEEELRSGTWATIRYTRKLAKPLIIIFPDGSVKAERCLSIF